MTTIFVSILNFNSKAHTLACLSSLAGSKTKDISLTVIVRDNASEEPFSLEGDYPFPVSVFYNKVNNGFAGGHNENITYALSLGADAVLLLNNDATVAGDTIEILNTVCVSDPSIGAAVPKIYFAKGHEYHKDRYAQKDLGTVIWYAGGIMDWRNILGKNKGVDEVDKGQYDTQEKTALFTGCCVLIKKEVFEKVGLFDEKYFLYYEDSDFAQRMKEMKFVTMYTPKAIAWHANASSGGGSGSELQDYYISRNRLLFGMRYAPVRARAALIRESAKLLFAGRQWQRQGVFDYYRKKFGRGSYPV